jgi:hypothetical protein
VKARAEILLRGTAEQRCGDAQFGSEILNQDGSSRPTQSKDRLGQTEAPARAPTSSSFTEYSMEILPCQTFP